MFRRKLALLIIFFMSLSSANASESYTFSEEYLDIDRPIVHIKKDADRIGIAIYFDKRSEMIKSACYETHPAWSVNYEKILFIADCYSGGEDFMRNANIYVMNEDGSEKKRLTESGENFVPSWSKDMSRIVFQSNRGGGEQIFIMNSDGSNQINISNNKLSDTQPDWSPVNDTILFSSGATFDSRNVSVMDADGTNRKQLTHFTENSVDNPKWSRDGSKILFILSQGAAGQLYIMNSDGSNLKNITPASYSILTASWSNDGEKIAVTKSNGARSYNIVILDFKNKIVYKAIDEFSSGPDW